MPHTGTHVSYLLRRKKKNLAYIHFTLSFCMEYNDFLQFPHCLIFKQFQFFPFNFLKLHEYVEDRIEDRRKNTTVEWLRRLQLKLLFCLAFNKHLRRIQVTVAERVSAIAKLSKAIASLYYMKKVAFVREEQSRSCHSLSCATFTSIRT